MTLHKAYILRHTELENVPFFKYPAFEVGVIGPRAKPWTGDRHSTIRAPMETIARGITYTDLMHRGRPRVIATAVVQSAARGRPGGSGTHVVPGDASGWRSPKRASRSPTCGSCC